MVIAITEHQWNKLIDKLRKTKQMLFDEMVEGNGRPPDEVVEYVMWELGDWLKEEEIDPWFRRQLIDRVEMMRMDYSR